MLKWKVPTNRETPRANAKVWVGPECKNSQLIPKQCFIQEKNYKLRHSKLSKTREESSEFEDGSSCFGSDSSVYRDEIANLDDVILSFKTKNFLEDEEDTAILHKSSRLSDCPNLDESSEAFQKESELPLKLCEKIKDGSRKEYSADESDVIISASSFTTRKLLYKDESATEISIMSEIFQKNKIDADKWDDISLDQTDDDEDAKELMYYVTSSIEETSSTSGISTGGSEWEWKPHPDILHTLKAFCSKCQKEDKTREEEQANETTPDKLEVDEQPSQENFSIFCPHVFQRKISKESSGNVPSDKSTIYTKFPLKEKLIRPPNYSRLSLPPTDNLVINPDNFQDKFFDDPIIRESKTFNDTKTNESHLTDINFNYGLRLNKFTFLPKSDKSKPKEEKQQKRRSHFFTDDFITSESSCSRSWLDDRPNRDVCSPTVTDCKAKLNKLFRSRSFSFSKIDLFFANSECNKQPPKDDQQLNDVSEKKRSKGIPKFSLPKGISKSLPKPKVMHSRPSIVDFFRPKLKSEDIENGSYVRLFPVQVCDFLYN